MAVAAAVLFYFNLVTVALFAYALAEVRWLYAFNNIPLGLVAIAALIAVHTWLVGLARRNQRIVEMVEPAIPLWLIYLVTSLVLMIVGAILAARAH